MKSLKLTNGTALKMRAPVSTTVPSGKEFLYQRGKDLVMATAAICDCGGLCAVNRVTIKGGSAGGLAHLTGMPWVAMVPGELSPKDGGGYECEDCEVWAPREGAGR